MPIRIMPPELAIKIAAGEVVERPAAIVKELLDNAIDAGSTTIRIEVRTGGQDYIRVIDNGSGIPADEIELAFQRHATSKVNELDDLFKINTLGFRGEALPSIASVSKMSLVSRTEGERNGIEITFEGGVMTSKEARIAPRGTIVTIRDLFYNVPARQKFLKSTTTEQGAISNIVSQYALAFPHLHLTLVAENRTSFQSPGTGSLLDTIRAVYGAEIAGAMLPVGRQPQQEQEADNSQEATMQQVGGQNGEITRVWGYTSRPDTSRGTRQYVNFLVNHRPVQSQNLSFAVEDAYRTLLMTGRHPIVVLNIELDPRMVDANVHPQKVEVKFADERNVFIAVQQAVRQALSGYSAVPSINPLPRGSEQNEEEQEGLQFGPTYVARPIPEMSSQPQEAAGPATPQSSIFSDSSHLDSASANQAFDRLANGSTGAQDAAQVGSPHEQRTGAGQVVESRKPLPPLRVIGSVAGGYIVCEGPDGMYIVDQRRAEERVQYERILAALRHGGKGISSIAMVEPIVLGSVSDTLRASAAAFAKLGFVGVAAARITAVPAMLANIDRAQVSNLVDEMVAAMLRQQDSSLWQSTLEIILAQGIASANAAPLDIDKARELVAQLEGCAMPRASAQGLPTIILVSKSQLEREFKRTGF